MCQRVVWGGFFTLFLSVFFPSEVPLLHRKSCSLHSGFIYSESIESILQYSWSTRSSLIFFTFSCRGRMQRQSNIYFRSQQSQLYQGLSEPFQINSQIFCWISFPPLTWKNTGICSPFTGAFPSCSCLFSLHFLSLESLGAVRAFKPPGSLPLSCSCSHPTFPKPHRACSGLRGINPHPVAVLGEFRGFNHHSSLEFVDN